MDKIEMNNDPNMEIIHLDLIQLITEKFQLQDEIKSINKRSYKDMKDCLLKILEVADKFDLVFENIQSKQEEINQQMKIWIGNFKSVRKLLDVKLKEMCVYRIEAPAGKAIPGLHTIMETRRVDNLENDTILEEIEKGYLWHDEVLRKVKVISVKN